MNLHLHLQLAGLSQIVLGAAHVFFPRRFHWKEELAHLSLLNRQIFLVHTFFLVLVLTLMGSLLLFAPETLLAPSRLAHLVLLGFLIFWAARLYCQFFVYESSLWRGHRLYTAFHVLFSATWIYYVAVLGAALWQQTLQPVG